MRVLDKNDRLLDAEFDLEGGKRRRSFILHSKSGGSATTPPRNPDYNPALHMVLDRLRALWATLEDAAVVSERTMHMPQEQRRLYLDDYAYPLAVGPVSSTDKLRKALCRAQRTVGRTDGDASRGNPSKRIQVWFTLPRCRAPLHLVPAPSCLTGLRRPLANPPTLETGITTA